ncbi:hypothetical protein ATN89_07260 [Comamonas thiooxydans]|nr:septal ring lytic transglycosylase RlpA family protein [Comamonas thiooxydans]MCO8247738.1 septal ring lytic transglycosylase RlpA family protein [Comamonas thiooxydans]OAD85147.1 hypothetical protein ATN89_07260 [Comamonas thiooxydans]
MAGCAPLQEKPEEQPPVVQSQPRKKGAQPTVSSPLLPDAYARSNYRDKGLGVKANKPADADKADLPEDSSKYELSPPRESDQEGLASWYGGQFHGRKTASGERFDSMDMTAAHKTLPFGTRVCVRSSVTGKSVVVRINDRGPFAPGRIIDLSKAAAQELGMLGLGIKPVELWQLDADEDECPATLNASGKKRHPSVAQGASASKTRAASANQPARKVSQTAKRKR